MGRTIARFTRPFFSAAGIHQTRKLDHKGSMRRSASDLFDRASGEPAECAWWIPVSNLRALHKSFMATIPLPAGGFAAQTICELL